MSYSSDTSTSSFPAASPQGGDEQTSTAKNQFQISQHPSSSGFVIKSARFPNAPNAAETWWKKKARICSAENVSHGSLGAVRRRIRDSATKSQL
jgi:hypothetical protein